MHNVRVGFRGVWRVPPVTGNTLHRPPMPSAPRTKVMSVRMGPYEAEVIRQEAELQGIPVSQFIRDAAFAQAIWAMAQRQAEPGRTLREIFEMVASGQGPLDD